MFQSGRFKERGCRNYQELGASSAEVALPVGVGTTGVAMAIKGMEAKIITERDEQSPFLPFYFYIQLVKRLRVSL